MKNSLFPSSLLLFLSLTFYGCAAPDCCLKQNPEWNAKSALVIKKSDITITAVGDIMLGTNYPDDRLAPNDGINLLKAISPVLSNSDITFGNLEGVLMEGGVAAKKCKNAYSCYVFRSPVHYAHYFKAAGFDVLSLANNHARDFGEEGRTATMKALDAVGLLHSGRMGDVARWQVKESSVSLIAFAPFGGSHDLLDIPLAQQQIRKEVLHSDIVLVSIHAGAEGNDVMRIPFKNEMFYGEDRGDVVAFSRAMIDAGADLVMGHGPHVPRAMELYKDRLIAYSLGNFTTYQGININGENGLAAILKVILSADGVFKEGQIISARQFRPEGTQLDKSHKVAQIIADLTAKDFPLTTLHFSDNGMLKPYPPTALIQTKTRQLQ